jgi:hypothetical protein
VRVQHPDEEAVSDERRAMTPERCHVCGEIHTEQITVLWGDLCERLKRAEHERDEARERMAFWQSAANVIEKERDALRAEVEALRTVIGMDTPRNVFELLEGMADAVEHLMRAHDCGCLGWESWNGHVAAARECAVRIRAALRAALDRAKGGP